MCETCGCGESDVRVEGEHEHVQPDGTIVRHAHHAPSHDHHAGEPHASHAHDPAHEHHQHHDPASPTPEARPVVVSLEAGVLAKNELAAAHNRGWFAGRGILALNLMSSPGSGKTTLLEKTLRRMIDEHLAVYVLEGDQETTNDADRIRKAGAPAVQINTGKGCHLEADMVLRGAARLAPKAGSVLFIENVGNLVCPALFDLGEAARVVLFSVTEGEDKPLKYPHMFRAADLVIMTKVDLLPHLDFDVAAARDAIERVKPGTPVLDVSSRAGTGLVEWLAWIAKRRAASA